MAWTITDGSVSIGTTEYFCMSASTTKTDQTTNAVVQAFFDLVNMAAGDEFRITCYEAISSGGTARVVDEWVVSGAQSAPIFVTPALTLCHGWEFSLDKLTGTDRTISWSIRQIPEA